MLWFKKKERPRRWGGQWAIRRDTLNNGKRRFWAVELVETGYGSVLAPRAGFDTCKEAEAWIEERWSETTAKSEIITSCEECE